MRAKRHSFERTEQAGAEAITPRITDNLPYNDSRVIRWMALLSGDKSAAAMAEALIARPSLQKCVFLGSE